MIVFKTETGSTYQVDHEVKRIRRLHNTKGLAPTERQGQDGEWKSYVDISLAMTGLRVSIVWKYDEVPNGVIARRTLTSRVVSVEQESDYFN